MKLALYVTESQLDRDLQNRRVNESAIAEGLNKAQEQMQRPAILF